MKGISYFFATFFFSGYFPKAPGTFASLIAGAMGLFILKNFSFSFLLLFLIAITAIGFFVSGRVEEFEKKEDPSIVVIDEAAGILLSMVVFAYFSHSYLANFVLSFVFFRIYDISKIFPVNKMEKIGGGSGIMLDDLVAGLMAGFSAVAVILIFGKF